MLDHPSKDWPNPREFWKSKRVIVTGGAGFLGSFVVEKLRERGCTDIFVPRSSDYDLRDLGAIRRLLAGALSGSGPCFSQIRNSQFGIGSVL